MLRSSVLNLSQRLFEAYLIEAGFAAAGGVNMVVLYR